MANVKEKIYFICNKRDGKSRRAYTVDEYNDLIKYLTDNNCNNTIETQLEDRLFPTILSETMNKMLDSKLTLIPRFKELSDHLKNLKEKKITQEEILKFYNCNPSNSLNSSSTCIFQPLPPAVSTGAGKKINKKISKNKQITKGKPNRKQKGGARNPLRIVRFIFSCMADAEAISRGTVLPLPQPQPQPQSIPYDFTREFISISQISQISQNSQTPQTPDDNAIPIIINVDTSANPIFYDNIESIEKKFIDPTNLNLPTPILLIQPNGEILIAKEIKPAKLHQFYAKINTIQRPLINPLKMTKYENFAAFVENLRSVTWDHDLPILQLQIPIDISKYFIGITKPYYIYILLLTNGMYTNQNADIYIKYTKFPIIIDKKYDTTQTIYVLDYSNENKNNNPADRTYPKCTLMKDIKKQNKKIYNVFSKYYSDNDDQQKFDIQFNFKASNLQNTKINKLQINIVCPACKLLSKNPLESPITVLAPLSSINADISDIYDILNLKLSAANLTTPEPRQPNVGGKSSSQKLKEYITILGRKRLIYKQGRSKLIKYHGNLIKIKDAKVLDKNKNKK